MDSYDDDDSVEDHEEEVEVPRGQVEDGQGEVNADRVLQAQVRVEQGGVDQDRLVMFRQIKPWILDLLCSVRLNLGYQICYVPSD